MGTSRYVLEQQTDGHVNCKIVYISHSTYENDWMSLMHMHPFCEIFYIQGGDGAFQFEEEEYAVKKDDIIIINPSVPHTEKSSADSPLEYIAIGVEMMNFSFDLEKDFLIFRQKSEKEDLLHYITGILLEMADKKPHYEAICESYLSIFLLKLERLTQCPIQALSMPPSRSSRECIKIKNYIESNYMHNITLDQLAALSNLSKHHLIHAFTKQCGCPPIQYLCQTRIQGSKELLANTDYTIDNVAQSCGFSSQSYFTQSFQKYCGMTPSAFRAAQHADRKS